MLAFDDKNIFYPNQIASEICCSSSHNAVSFVQWKPNDALEYQTLIRDWRGMDMCIPKQRFEVTKNIQRDRIFQIDVPLLHCECSESGGNDFCDTVSKLVPVCPLQKAYNGSMFSQTECTMKNIIYQPIMLSVKADRLFGAAAEQNQTYIDNEIMSLVKSSNVLLRKMKEKYHEIVSERKKSAKEIFFYFVGYRQIFLRVESLPAWILSNEELVKCMRHIGNYSNGNRPVIVRQSGRELQNVPIFVQKMS